MRLFGTESEKDVLLEEEDIRSSLRDGSTQTHNIGAWALMRSSMSAEKRELKAVDKYRLSLENEERKLDRVRRLKNFAHNMVALSR